MYRFLLFCLLMLSPLWSWAVGADSEEPVLESGAIMTTPPDIQPPACSDVYSIGGDDHVKVNMPSEYTLKSTLGLPVPNKVEYMILSASGEVLAKSDQQEKWLHYFVAPGEYTLQAHFSTGGVTCSGGLKKAVTAYNEMILYIGEKTQGLDDDVNSVFLSKAVFLQNIPTDNDFHIEQYPNAWNYMNSADTIVFGYTDIIGLFSDIEKLQRIKEINFSSKKIYIISGYSHAFLSKVLAGSLAKVGIEHVSLISEEQFHSLLSRWSFGDDRTYALGEELSYEKSEFAFSLGSFLEYLSYSGVSYQFLGFLLSISVVALLFNIFKQVVGVYVFGIYYPIILAIILSQIGISFSLVFAGVALLALGIVALITRKIYLLFNAKRALLVSVYILFAFLALGLDNYFSIGIFRASDLDNPAMIVSIFVILLIVEKFYEEASPIVSLRGALNTLQYIFMTGMAFLILTSQTLLYFLISYPDTIFIVILLNLLVGRYTGLQLLEYVRFTPILRNLNEEE